MPYFRGWDFDEDDDEEETVGSSTSSSKRVKSEPMTPPDSGKDKQISTDISQDTLKSKFDSVKNRQNNDVGNYEKSVDKNTSSKISSKHGDAGKTQTSVAAEENPKVSTKQEDSLWDSDDELENAVTGAVAAGRLECRTSPRRSPRKKSPSPVPQAQAKSRSRSRSPSPYRKERPVKVKEEVLSPDSVTSKAPDSNAGKARSRGEMSNSTGFGIQPKVEIASDTASSQVNTYTHGN